MVFYTQCFATQMSVKKGKSTIFFENIDKFARFFVLELALNFVGLSLLSNSRFILTFDEQKNESFSIWRTNQKVMC